MVQTFSLNSLHPSVVFHIENNHLICKTNQMTGFYIQCNTGLKWVKHNSNYSIAAIKSFLYGFFANLPLGLMKLFNIFQIPIKSVDLD